VTPKDETAPPVRTSLLAEFPRSTDLQIKLVQATRELKGLARVGIEWSRVTLTLEDALTMPYRYLSKLAANGAPQRPASHFAQSPDADVKETKPTWFHNYFTNTTEGPGIWKWEHYFPAYEQYLSKFRRQSPTIVEIGIFSGGSLPMWHQYFGKGTRVVGIDLEPVCKKYQTDQTQIFIGDQGDRTFWRTLFAEIGPVDIVVDDGGHRSDQQIITLEECLPNLVPGGILLIEDIHGSDNRFFTYLSQLAKTLLAMTDVETIHYPGQTVEDYIVSPSLLQQHIKSITLFPYCAIIERNEHTYTDFRTQRAGNRWEPFPHTSKDGHH